MSELSLSLFQEYTAPSRDDVQLSMTSVPGSTGFWWLLVMMGGLGTAGMDIHHTKLSLDVAKKLPKK